MTNWPLLAVTAIGMWGLRQSGQLAYLLNYSYYVFISERALTVCWNSIICRTLNYRKCESVHGFSTLIRSS